MIAVLFEVHVPEEKMSDYLKLAAALKVELETAEGFISVERFQSLSDSGKLLSLSYWKDEASVAQWRNSMNHRLAQSQGRESIFQKYHLTVAQTIRQYTEDDRSDAPKDSNQYFHLEG